MKGTLIDLQKQRIDHARRARTWVLLVLSGLACLAGLYPLTGALRDGVATKINRKDQMILTIYISLGVFLLIAARNVGDRGAGASVPLL